MSKGENEMKKSGTEKTIREVFLRNHGCHSISEVNNWFLKAKKNQYRLQGTDEFLKILVKFKYKKILVVGDYDADGICASANFVIGLKSAGFKYVRTRIPTRKEGYGLSKKIVKEAIDSGTDLIVTCDNGITQLEEVQFAKQNGISVIITDHHEPLEELPMADCICNPHIKKEGDYCGATIVYLLMKEIAKQKAITQMCAFATIATIGDIVSLTEYNYVLVRQGLRILEDKKSLPSGLRSLINISYLSRITAKDLAFIICPIINAPERMYDGGANDMLKLLLFDGDCKTAKKLAAKCIKINEARKSATKKALILAEKEIQEDTGDIIILYLPEVSAGLLGIVAGQVKSKYEKPTILLSNTEGTIRASCRSSGEIHIKQMLDSCNGYFEKYGGHENAGGFTLKASVKIEEFMEAARDYAKKHIKQSKKEAEYDLEINSDQIDATISELQQYEPFGKGNPQIRFLIKDCQAIADGKYCKIGREGKKVRFKIANASVFSYSHNNEFKELQNKPFVVDLLGTLSQNKYMGKLYNQIQFTDFLLKDKKKKISAIAEKMLSIR